MDSNAALAASVVQSVLGLIGSIAWPLVALAFIFRFRPQIAELLKRISKLELPGLKIDLLKTDLLEAEGAAARASATTQGLVAESKAPDAGDDRIAPRSINDLPNNLADRLLVSPDNELRKIVAEAYEDVEDFLRRKMSDAGVKTEKRGSYLMEIALETRQINYQTAVAILSLLRLRSFAVNGLYTFDRGTAREYLELAVSVIDSIEAPLPLEGPLAGGSGGAGGAAEAVTAAVTEAVARTKPQLGPTISDESSS